MPDFVRGKFLIITAVFVLNGVFLFSINTPAALAVGDYNKPFNGTLNSSDWNNLPTDFVKTWAAATMTGPLGIGTTTAPASGLLVNGPIVASNFSGLYTGTLGAQNISAGAFGSNTGGGNYSFPGNVGIGTTGPSDKLHLVGLAELNSVGFESVLRVQAGYGTSNRNHGIGFSITDKEPSAGIYVTEAGTGGTNLLFTTAASYATPTQLERMRITSNGNVGIGTTSPRAPLTISNFTTPDAASHSDSGWLGIGKSSTDSADIWYSGASADLYVDNKGNYDSGNIYFRTKTAGTPVNAVTILGSGNVGIGTTNPIATMQVDTPATTNLGNGIRINRPGAAYYSGLEYTTNGIVDWSQGVNAAGFGIYEDGLAATTRFLIKDGGNVGIGTTAPTSKLHIEQATTGIPLSLSTLSATTNDITGLKFKVDTVTTDERYKGAILFQRTGSRSRGDLHFALDYVEDNTNADLTDSKMMIQGSTGNVGIGTTAPGKLLEVNGQAKFNNFAYGSTPLSTDTLAITTVEYVNAKTGGSGGVGSGTSGQTLRHNGTGWIADSTLFNNGTNVGIGTTSPSQALDVNGSIALSTNIIQTGTANQLDINPYALVRFGRSTNNAAFGVEIYNGDGTGTLNHKLDGTGNSYFAVNNGNVGIGTVAPVNKLDVYEATSGDPSLATNNGIAFFDAVGVGLEIGRALSSPYGSWLQSKGKTNGTAYPLLLNPVGGNVGIGTTAPGKLLEVNGQAKFNSFAYGSTPLSTDTLAITTVEYVNAKTGGSGGVGSGTSGQTLRHNGTGWIADSTLFNNGTNVGIGTTSPGAKLEVAGTTYLSKTTGYKYLNVDSNASDLKLAFTNSSDAVLWELRDDGGVFELNEGTNINNRITVLPTSGNVGIGTTAPAQKLEVIGNAKFGGSDNSFISILGAGESTGLKLSSSAFGYKEIQSFETEPLYINRQGNNVILNATGGNVGIGTAAPGKLLEVNGQAKFNSFAYGSTPLSTDTLAITTVEYVNAKTGGSGGVGSGTSGQTLRHNGTGWIADSTLFNNGTNVGIGTTGPAYKLDVQADTVGASGASNAATIKVRNTKFAEVDTGFGFFEHTSGGDLRFGTTDSESIRAFVGGSEKMRITTDGNVGIGLTDPINGRLEIKQSTDGSTYGIAVRDAAGTGSGRIYMESGLFKLQRGTNTNQLVLDNTGNVGIGTTAPGAKLDISANNNVGSSLNTLRFIDVDSSITFETIQETGAIEFYSSDSTSPGITAKIVGTATHTNVGALDFYTGTGGSATTKMSILGNGSVGIGTTAPGKLLEVNGQAKFNSFAYGSTPLSTDTLAITTVEYVNAKTGGSGGVGSGTSGQTLRHNGTGWIADSTLFNNGTNVGIGTTAPGKLLEISSLTYPTLRITDTSNNYWTELVQGNTIGYLDTHASVPSFNFRMGTNNIITMLNTGNVGIGTTGPGEKLEIAGNIILSNDSRLYFKELGGQKAGIRLSSSDNLHFFVDDATVNSQMILLQNGNVGIGTTAPGSRLEVKSSAVNTFPFAVVTSDGSNLFFTKETSAGDGEAYLDNNAGTVKVKLSSNGDSYLDGGNVGIGTTAPGKLLEVNGQAKFNSFAYGSTPLSTDTLAITTVEYVNAKTGGSGGVGAGTSGQTLRHNGTGWIADSTLFNNGTNVGIGTTNPLAKLDIRSGITRTTVGPTVFNYMLSTDADDFRTGLQTSLLGGVTSADRTLLLQSGTYQISTGLFTNGGERLSLNPNGGNVGIGTTNPVAKLAVVKPGTTGKQLTFSMISPTGYGATNFYLDYSSDFGYANGKAFEIQLETLPLLQLAINNTGTTGKVIFPTGNVGVGTTAPSEKLEVGGNLRIASNGHIKNAGIMYFDAASEQFKFENDDFTLDTYTGAQITMTGKATFPLEIRSGANDNQLFLAAGGNVGIGTTAPGKLLEVNGQAKFNSFAYGSTPLSTDTLAITTVEYVNAKTGGSGGVGSGTSGQTLRHNGTGWIADSTLFNNGTNVGIGTTAPGAKLEISATNPEIRETVNWAAGATGKLSFYSTSGAVVFNSGIIGTTPGDSTRGLQFYTSSAGNTVVTAMSILGNGNVGIGTTAPGVKLDVQGSHSTEFIGLRLFNTAGTANQLLTLRFDNASQYSAAIKSKLYASSNGGDLSFWTSPSTGAVPTQKMVIDSTGNVGIGTTGPSQALQVGLTTPSGVSPYALINGLRISGGDTSNTIWNNNRNIVISRDTGGLIQLTKTSSPTIGLTVDTTSGSVGIGTTAPGKLLEVNGQAKFNSFAYGSTPLSTDTLAITTVEYVNAKTGGSGGIGSGTSGQTLRHNGTGWIADSTLFNNGTNVGIGTTAPGALLDVYRSDLTTGHIQTDVRGQTSADYISTSVAEGVNLRIQNFYTNNQGVTGLIFNPYSGVSGSARIAGISDPNGDVSLAFQISNDQVIAEAMRISSTGNVGIGTTAPTNKLHVSDDVNVGDLTLIKASQLGNTGPRDIVGLELNFNRGAVPGGKIQAVKLADAGSALAFSTGAAANGAFGERMRIDSAGNVGVGTTAPNKTLHVIGDVRGGAYYNNNSGDGWLINQDSGTNRGLYYYNTAGTWDLFDGGTSKISMGTNGNIQMDGILTVSGTGNTTIAGNVGIGTTAPGKLLEVNGQAKFNSFAYGSTPLSTDTLAITTVEYVNAKTGGSGGVGSGTSGQTLRHNGTGWIADSTLFNNGTNVGIGTTAPGAKLEVKSSGLGSTPFGILAADGSSLAEIREGEGGGGIFELKDSGGTIIHKIAYTGNNYFNGGNVGIGTTAPGEKLDVNGNINASRYLKLTHVSNPYIQLYDGTNNGYLQVSAGLLNLNANTAGMGMSFTTGSTEQMRILSNGNVGIGTTAPGANLEVKNTILTKSTGSSLNTIDKGSTGSVAYTGYYTAGVAKWWTGTKADATDNYEINTSYNGASPYFVIQRTSGNVGIGTTAPGKLLEVNGQAKFNSFAYGSTPLSTDTLAITTVEYVNAKTGGSGGVGSGTSGQTLRHNGTGWIADSTLFNNGTNVGIGTTSPSEQLELAKGNDGGVLSLSRVDSNNISALDDLLGSIVFKSNAGDTTQRVFAKINANVDGSAAGSSTDQPSRLTFWTSGPDNSSTLTEKMRIDNLGNVGIGTASPGGKLEIKTASNDVLKLNRDGWVGGEEANILFSHNGTYNAKIGSWVEGGGSMVALRFFTVDAGAQSQKMVIRGNGNVGIGTTSPGAKLHVNDNVKIGAPVSSESLAIANTATGGYGALSIIAETSTYSSYKLLLQTQPSAMGMFMSMGGTKFLKSYGYNAASSIGIGTQNNEDTIYLTAGNVGIGTTAPGKLLEVNGQAKFNSFAYGSTPLSTDTLAITTVEYVNAKTGGSGGVGSGTSGQTLRHNGTGWIADSTLFNNGTNVGIGTSTPAYKLQVHGTMALFDPALNKNALWIGNNGSISSIDSSAVAGGNFNPIVFRTSNTERVRIANDGNIGIGTTNPTNLLDVGNYSATSDITNTIRLSGRKVSNGVFANFRLSNSSDTGGSYFGIASRRENNNYGVSADFTVNNIGAGATPLTAMTLQYTGNVGIGTTAPGKLLEVNGQAKFNNFAYGSTPLSTDTLAITTVEYVNAKTGGSGGIGSGTSGQTLRHNGTGWIADSTLFNNGTNVGIGTTAPGAYKLKVAGNVAITGTLETQTGSDFAEEFSVTAELEPGTVVVLGDEGYKSAKASSKSYDQTVIGVVSDNPSIIAGRQPDLAGHKVIVAMVGVVKVKVSAINGIIKKGDLLTTSSLNGFAMKADLVKTGTIIGKALEDMDGKKDEIKVLVNLQ